MIDIVQWKDVRRGEGVVTIVIVRSLLSVSTIVTELVQQQPTKLPYAGLIDDDEQISQNVGQILARLGTQLSVTPGR